MTPPVQKVTVTKKWAGSDGKQADWPEDAKVTVIPNGISVIVAQ